jgi:hypothetical protein
VPATPYRLLLRPLDLFRPRRPLSSREVFQHRCITGSCLVGLFVMLYSAAQSLAAGSVFGLAVFGGAAALIALVLVAAKAGLPLQALAWTMIGLAGALAALFSLVGAEPRLDQLNWLVVVPLLARAWVLQPEEPGVRAGSAQRALLLGGALALGLGLLVVALHALGIHIGRPLQPIPKGIVATEHALFIGTVVALLSLHELTVRGTEEELRMLRKLLLVCSWCRKVREADGAWVRPDVYIARHQRKDLSHGMCPDCFALHGDG